MSTKIYDAYKIVDPDVWGTLWKIRDRARKNAVLALKAHYAELVRDMDPDSEEYRTEFAKAKEAYGEKTEWAFRLGRAEKLVRDGFKKAVTDPYRGEYQLEVSLAVYPYVEPHHTSFYVCAFWDRSSVMSDVLHFLPKMPELIDFHYQNQSDKPEEISDLAWEERGRIWDNIMGVSGIGNHLVLDIVSWDGFYLLNPYLDILSKWHKNPPELPSRIEWWAGRLSTLQKIRDLGGAEVRDGKIVTRDSGEPIVYEEEGCWWLVYNGIKSPRETLNQAADRAYFEHMPEREKMLIQSLMDRHTEKKEKEKDVEGKQDGEGFY